jgi:hypothetical protein
MQEAPTFLHGNESVFECGGGRIVRYAQHLDELLGHPCFDRRLVILILDFVKRRCVERQSARRIEGICRTEICGARTGG